MDQSKGTDSFIKRKGRLVLAILALAAYVGYAVSTFAENSFWIELFSPVMTILCVIVILACMKDMGKFRILAILLASGI
nr:hypothetical protein [Lachnospiraceae bacterium]